MIDFLSPVLYGFGFVCLFAISWTIKSLKSYVSATKISPKTLYIDGMSEKAAERPFPTLSSKAEVDISLVIPAYNEQDRIPIMLNQTISFLRNDSRARNFFPTFEILVVNDGSRDNTVNRVCQFAAVHNVPELRVLSLLENRGKGHAVKQGVLSSRGKYVLMVDADGATEIEDLVTLYSLMQSKLNSNGVVLGSRAHLMDEAISKRSPLRNLLMHSFHFLVSSLCVRDIRDTQCGFKLFPRSIAIQLFEGVHIDRWGFDVELFYRAQRLGIKTLEVPVHWTEIDGSKLNVATASIMMLRDVICIPLLYRLGIWKLSDKANLQILKKTE
eukprot:ANDGO_05667.mRNA.1 Dolichyl-phosphate beta-glucosyltransferase